MMKKIKWTRIIYIIGIIAIVIGVIDPLEGSIAILAGSAMLALSTFITGDRHSKYFIISFVMILLGVSCLFYFSSFGGFGGDSGLSLWWGLLILPYPAGWIYTLIILVTRTVRKNKFLTGK